MYLLRRRVLLPTSVPHVIASPEMVQYDKIDRQHLSQIKLRFEVAPLYFWMSYDDDGDDDDDNDGCSNVHCVW